MKVLVSGDRKWKDRAMIFEALDTWQAQCGISEIIEGCAEGADRMAEEWAQLRGVPIKHYPAPWAHYGKSAGPRRNSWMLIDGGPDVVIAFHDRLGSSVGTGDMVHKAKRANVMVVHVVHPQDEPLVLAASTPPENAPRPSSVSPDFRQ